jgi:hypothetical protein
MLFFYFLAGLSAATGWMVFWAILGMLLSDRPAYLFFLPLMAACFEHPKLGVAIVLLTWLMLAIKEINAAADRHDKRVEHEALIAAVAARQPTG